MHLNLFVCIVHRSDKNLQLGSVYQANIPFRCNHTFTDAQIDVLVALVLTTRPGSIQLFNALEPFVTSLISGEVQDDPRKFILDDEVGLLGTQNIKLALERDRKTLESHQASASLRIMDSKSIADQKAKTYLPLISKP